MFGFLRTHGMPRPGAQAAYRSYRLGLFQGRHIPWHGYARPNRRYQPDRRFHGLSAGLPAWPDQIRPLAPADPAPRLFQCPKCGYDYVTYINHQLRCLICAAVVPFGVTEDDSESTSRRRARYTRPAFGLAPGRRLCLSRQRAIWRQFVTRPGGYWYHQVRRRTRFAQSAGTLHFLASRRYMASKCRAWGFKRLKPGIWHDPIADVVYLQTDRMSPAPYIGRGA